MSAPMTPDREQEIRETHPGGWYDGPWTQEYVEADGDSPAYNRVVHKESGTTLATLPDFAGGIALFIADAHDAVPELLAEVARLRERTEEAETNEAQLKGRVRGLRAYVEQLEAARTTAAADRDKQIIAWLEKKAREEGTSNKDSRVRATATYRLADKLSRGAVRPACPPVSPEDPHDSPLHHTYALGRDLPEVTPEPPAVTAARWNAQYPVGTPVYAYPGCRPEDDPKAEQLTTRTRSAASVLGGHTAVVWVEGHGACISLTHVYPRPEGGAS